MGLQFCSIASGSKGNCYIVKADDTVLLIDVGISGKKIFEGLENVGILPENVKGILVTHEHSDHIKGINVVCKKCENVNIYANRRTWEQLSTEKLEKRFKMFKTGEKFKVDNIKIKPFKIHHDAAEPVGFILEYEDKKISILTDTGHITEEIYKEVKDVNLLIIESNHEENIVRVCSYPYKTKMRILGDYGHLSNNTASKYISKIVKEKKINTPIRILLAHLSKENNTPEMAMLAVRNELQENGLLSESLVKVDVLLQDKQSCIYNV